MTVLPGRMRMQEADRPAPVTALELFFDLVFVFALVQVTGFMAADLSWHGLLRGLLILGLLWWSWVCYSWLGNMIKADEGAGRLALLAGMAAMFVLALSIPEAFNDAPGGLPGPVVIAVCYFAFRAIHLLLFWILSRDDPGLRAQLYRFLPSMLAATVLLLVAAMAGGAVQTGLWAAAVLADYLGNFLGGAGGWRLRSIDHFAERHRRIVLVALGVSLAGVGAGVTGVAVSTGIVLAALPGLGLAAALWWAYFDVAALLAQRAVAALPDPHRVRVARDAYTYLHLPLIAGIVLTTLGLKKVLEYAGDTEHDLTYPLTGPALAALLGGVVLYLLAQVGFKLRTMGTVNPYRGAGAVILLGLVGLGPLLPALATLGLLTALMIGLLAVETRVLGSDRDRIRQAPD